MRVLQRDNLIQTGKTLHQKIDQITHPGGQMQLLRIDRVDVRPSGCLVFKHQTQTATAHVPGNVPFSPQQNAEPFQRPVQRDLTVIAAQCAMNLDVLRTPPVAEAPHPVGCFVLTQKNTIVVLQFRQTCRRTVLFQVQR